MDCKMPLVFFFTGNLLLFNPLVLNLISNFSYNSEFSLRFPISEFSQRFTITEFIYPVIFIAKEKEQEIISRTKTKNYEIIKHFSLDIADICFYFSARGRITIRKRRLNSAIFPTTVVHFEPLDSRC